MAVNHGSPDTGPTHTRTWTNPDLDLDQPGRTQTNPDPDLDQPGPGPTRTWTWTNPDPDADQPGPGPEYQLGPGPGPTRTWTNLVPDPAPNGRFISGGRFMVYWATGLGPGLPDYQVTGLGPP